MESVIAGTRMECAASFCCVVHPHIGILAIVAYTSNHGLNIGNNSLLKPDSDFSIPWEEIIESLENRLLPGTQDFHPLGNYPLDRKTRTDINIIC